MIIVKEIGSIAPCRRPSLRRITDDHGGLLWLLRRGRALGVANRHCLFLSRLSLSRIAELERPRRHPKAFGTPFYSLSTHPSSVPCRRSDVLRVEGVPSMFA